MNSVENLTRFFVVNLSKCSFEINKELQKLAIMFGNLIEMCIVNTTEPIALIALES